MNLLLIRPDQIKISPKFLNYLFKLYRNNGYFISIAQHAVNQSSINQTKLKGIKIPTPPIQVQHSIASKIDTLFAKIDSGARLIERTQKLLEQCRQSILKSAFEGKLIHD